ncbi:MAG: T9SS type A sorting domain-containing protein [Lewinellaceae bacterium]|nr:T9SS type A sorting domain-containing protein [Lewinellaceae bacterium]
MKPFNPFAILYPVASVFFLLTVNCLHSQAVHLECDSDAVGNISQLGEVDEFTFDANQGDYVIVRLVGGSSAFDPSLTLQGPDGMAIQTVTSFGAVVRISQVLNTSGTFKLLAKEKDDNATGQYGISLQILKPECAGQISCRGTAAGNITSLAGMQAYSFSLEDTTSVILRMIGSSSTFDNRFELYRLGNPVSLIESDETFGEVARLENGLNLLPGDYMVVCMEKDGNATGPFSLAIQELRLECATEIGCSGTVQGNISGLAGMQAFYFTLEGPTSVLLRMESPEVNFDHGLELYRLAAGADAQEGAVVTFGEVARLDRLNLSPGTYMAVCMEREGDFTGPFSLAVQELRLECATPISCEEVALGEITGLAEMAAFSFTIAEPTTVLLRLESDEFSFSNKLELYRISGQEDQLISTAETFGEVVRLNMFSLAPGTYIAVGMEADGTVTGHYGLAMQWIRNECAMALGCEEDQGASINSLAEMDNYAVDGEPGSHAIFRVRAAVSGIQPLVEVYDQSGALLYSQSTSSGVVRIQHEFTGESPRVFILVMDEAGNRVGDYGISIQLLKESCATSLACSEDITGTIGELAEMDAFTFMANQGSRLAVRARSIANSFEGWLELYDEEGALLATEQSVSGLARLDYFPLPYSGRYYLLYMEKEGNELDNYGLSLQLVSPSCTMGEVSCGMVLSSNLPHPAAMDAWRINSEGGGLILIKGYSPAGSEVGLALELYTQAGQPVEAQSIGGNILSFWAEVPPNEDLVLLAMDDNGLQTGSYQLSIALLSSSACVSPMACGETLTASLSAVPQMAVYSIAAGNGARILARARTQNGADNISVELYSRSERLDVRTGSLPRLEYTLGSDGPYFLAVSGLGTAGSTPIYTGLQVLNNFSCGQPIGYNDSLTFNLGQYAAMAAFNFQGSEGDVGIGQFTGTIPGFNARFELYNAAGERIGLQNSFGSGARLDFTLPADGPYKLLAMEADGDPGSYNGLCLQKVNPGFDAREITDGSMETASITLPAEMDVFNYWGTAGEVFSVEAASLAQSFNPYIEFYNPDGIMIASGQGLATAEILEQLIQSTGWHTLLVRDGDFRDAGAYVLNLMVPATAEFSEKSSLRVAPNPVLATLYAGIGLTEGGVVGLSLTDINGRACTFVQRGWLAEGEHSLEIDVSALPAGVYICVLEVEGEVVAREKVLVAH